MKKKNKINVVTTNRNKENQKQEKKKKRPTFFHCILFIYEAETTSPSLDIGNIGKIHAFEPMLQLRLTDCK